MERRGPVCVTGGAGYLGSCLVKKLLDEGYTVHATVRNLEDESKVGLLKSFPGAHERLKLFQANIYRPQDFELPIQGCQFVFHVATPMLHTQGYQYNNSVEATVAAVREIGSACLKSGTVKRLIYTASVVAASALKDDGNGFKASVDETCWTPLNFLNAFPNQFLKDYVEAKTLAEKELLKFGEEEGLEVVTLGTGLVGGNTPHFPYISGSVSALLSVITQEERSYDALKGLEEGIGKVPIVHVEDVCEAHLFAIRPHSMNGRFLCASSFVSIADIATFYLQNYPEFIINQQYLNDPKREIKWGARKLVEEGFQYKYGMKEILDDSITCARSHAIL